LAVSGNVLSATWRSRYLLRLRLAVSRQHMNTHLGLTGAVHANDVVNVRDLAHRPPRLRNKANALEALQAPQSKMIVANSWTAMLNSTISGLRLADVDLILAGCCFSTSTSHLRGPTRPQHHQRSEKPPLRCSSSIGLFAYPSSIPFPMDRYQSSTPSRPAPPLFKMLSIRQPRQTYRPGIRLR
jgi:hypothetical protein